MTDANSVMFAAAAFAARAHRHGLRKDKVTPYVAHPFRVCLIVRHVFGIDSPNVLAAALLHDTIEDTPTDYDDIAEEFGTDVADWVSALTKEMRLPEEEREARYHAVLAAAAWPVYVCKLADIYDNLTDSASLDPKQRKKTIRRSKEYLAVLKPELPMEAKLAFQLTAARLAEVKETLE